MKADNQFFLFRNFYRIDKIQNLIIIIFGFRIICS